MEDYAVKILQQLGLTEQMLRDHVFRPDDTRHAILDIDLHQAGDGSDDTDITKPPPGWFYHLNIPALRDELIRILNPCLSGYSMQLRRYGQVLFDVQKGFSKMPGDGGLTGIEWRSYTPMHVASVSKLITAMALTKLLLYRNISPDALIWPYLPNYWSKGPGIDQLTFRNLLTHKTGLVITDKPPGSADFQSMKASIAKGVSGLPGYLNIHYGLCRILISTIDAPYLFNLLNPADDKYWDATTIRYYTKYVTENIFAPLGIESTFLHPDPDALAYEIPVKVPGFNSGDMSWMAGSSGWHLSVNDLLTIMAAFRRGGSIIDTASAQLMLDRQFGIDKFRDSNLGRIYAKGGFWSDKKGGAVEQSNVFFLPKGMELAILANAPFCQPDGNFMDNVLETINNNIELNLFTVTAVTAVGALAAYALVRQGRAPKKKP